MLSTVTRSAGGNKVPDGIVSALRQRDEVVTTHVLSRQLRPTVGAASFVVPEHRLPLRNGVGAACSGSLCPGRDRSRDSFVPIPEVAESLENTIMLTVGSASRRLLCADLVSVSFVLFLLPTLNTLRVPLAVGFSGDASEGVQPLTVLLKPQSASLRVSPRLVSRSSLGGIADAPGFILAALLRVRLAPSPYGGQVFLVVALTPALRVLVSLCPAYFGVCVWHA